MKRVVSTLLLLVVALGLGAYVYFVESERKPASEVANEKSKVFSNLDPAKIEEVAIKTATDTTSLMKDDGLWKIVNPIEAGVDDSELSGITTNLGTLEVQRVVDEKPADLSQYGLSPAKTQITFRQEGDAAPRQLLLGEKTATGGDLYAKVGDDPKVFLVSGFLEATFNRSTFDLREKGILKFDREKVTQVEVVSPDHTVTFVKANDNWSMSTPKVARADFGTVEGLIGRVSTGQMKSLIADSTTDLAQYGLDKPTHQLNFLSGSARTSLLIGNKTPDGLFYAKDASRPLVFTLDNFLTEDLNKTVDDFRQKDVFEFRTFSGSRLEITRGTATTVFDKQKNKDGAEQWALAQPKPAKALEVSKIEDFLSKISSLRAASFVDALPKDAVQDARIVARYSDNKKEETVVIYKSGENGLAVRGNEPGAAQFAIGDYDQAIKALEALK